VILLRHHDVTQNRAPQPLTLVLGGQIEVFNPLRMGFRADRNGARGGGINLDYIGMRRVKAREEALPHAHRIPVSKALEIGPLFPQCTADTCDDDISSWDINAKGWVVGDAFPDSDCLANFCLPDGYAIAFARNCRKRGADRESCNVVRPDRDTVDLAQPESISPLDCRSA